MDNEDVEGREVSRRRGNGRRRSERAQGGVLSSRKEGLWRNWPLLIGLAGFLVACDDGGVSGPRPNGGGGGGGGGGGDEQDGVVVVELTDQLRFEPTEVLISAGTMVRWISRSNQRHTVTPDGHEEFERAEAQQANWTMVEAEFLEPGIYDYYCEMHRELGMVGRVIVLEM